MRKQFLYLKKKFLFWVGQTLGLLSFFLNQKVGKIFCVPLTIFSKCVLKIHHFQMVEFQLSLGSSYRGTSIGKMSLFFCPKQILHHFFCFWKNIRKSWNLNWQMTISATGFFQSLKKCYVSIFDKYLSKIKKLPKLFHLKSQKPSGVSIFHVGRKFVNQLPWKLAHQSLKVSSLSSLKLKKMFLPKFFNKRIHQLFKRKKVSHLWKVFAIKFMPHKRKETFVMVVFELVFFLSEVFFFKTLWVLKTKEYYDLQLWTISIGVVCFQSILSVEGLVFLGLRVSNFFDFFFFFSTFRKPPKSWEAFFLKKFDFCSFFGFCIEVKKRENLKFFEQNFLFFFSKKKW